MKELTVEATKQNVEIVTRFVDEQLEKAECPLKAQMQIDVAIDELFANIAQYAYAPEVGCVTVRVEVETSPSSVAITFIDGGKPFDPLKRSDPDVKKCAEERNEGGLGIYIVKKSMDEIIYEYSGGKNILRIKKKI